MKKEEIIEAMKAGAVFIVTLIPNFGTTSLTRPIKTGLPDRKKYSINGVEVHHSTGKKILDSGLLVFDSSERVGLHTERKYKLISDASAQNS